VHFGKGGELLRVAPDLVGVLLQERLGVLLGARDFLLLPARGSAASLVFDEEVTGPDLRWLLASGLGCGTR